MWKEKPSNCYVYRIIDEESDIEIGIVRVLFGYRVRAGRINDIGYEYDYCFQGKLQYCRIFIAVLKNLFAKYGFDTYAFPNTDMGKRPFYLFQEFKDMLKESKEYGRLEIPNIPSEEELMKTHIRNLYELQKRIN